MTKEMTLAEAEAQVAKLRAEAEANQFSSPASIRETLIEALNVVEYKDEPQLDSVTGKQIERVNLEVLASLVQHFIGSTFTAKSGKKYVNVIRN
jgi:mRNA-degrading endonuclease HigB of HigAB toxin-antitoxin module